MLVLLPAEVSPPDALDLLQDGLHLQVADLLQDADGARAEEHLPEGGRIKKEELRASID